MKSTIPMRPVLLITGLLFATDPLFGQIPGIQTPPEDGKLRIIAFGAHPDDCEIQAGGSAALWARRGHHVLFVSVTNGDIGHWREAGGPLALRRKSEVDEAHTILGVQGVVLDIHDGELEPTLENRRTFTRLIRQWNADLVLGHRPNDYHPDHRYTGVLMQDAAYMVTVPFFCPDVPAMKKNPVFMYYADRFEKPSPFEPSIVVSIDPVVDRKLDALGVMISQFAEGGANGGPELYPANDPAHPKGPAGAGAGRFRPALSIDRDAIPGAIVGLVPGQRIAVGQTRGSFRTLRIRRSAGSRRPQKTIPVLRLSAAARKCVLPVGAGCVIKPWITRISVDPAQPKQPWKDTG